MTTPPISDRFQKRLETRLRRQQMRCVSFDLKIDVSHLSNEELDILFMIFVQAKWERNYLLDQLNNGVDIFTLKMSSLKEVVHYDKDKNAVTSVLTNFPGHIKQDVHQQLLSDLHTLAQKKKKGSKVGQLKFSSECNYVNMRQHSITYTLYQENDRVKLPGLKKPVRVSGMKQIRGLKGTYYEIANAKLLHLADGYHIRVCIFVPKTNKPKMGKLGIDLGCNHTVTCSNGETVKALVEESERTKREQRRLDKKQKGSNNRWRQRGKLRKAHLKDVYRRKDIANKVVSSLSKHDTVMQDEQLTNWSQIGFGKVISHSILGRVKSGLKQHGALVLSKWVPTTRFCHHCGSEIALDLGERVFKCPYCGHTEDRDVHAAKNMLWFSEHTRHCLVDTYDRKKLKVELDALFPNRVIEKKPKSKSVKMKKDKDATLEPASLKTKKLKDTCGTHVRKRCDTCHTGKRVFQRGRVTSSLPSSPANEGWMKGGQEAAESLVQR